MDVVEINPILDERNGTAELAVDGFHAHRVALLRAALYAGNGAREYPGVAAAQGVVFSVFEDDGGRI